MSIHLFKPHESDESTGSRTLSPMLSLTNAIYPQWQYRNIELVRIDERTGNLYVLAGELDFEIKSTGGYEP